MLVEKGRMHSPAVRKVRYKYYNNHTYTYIFFYYSLRKHIRRNKFITDLEELDWYNIFVYFFMRKWTCQSEIWLNRELRRLQSDDKDIQWENLLGATGDLLEWQDERIRRDVESSVQGGTESVDRLGSNIRTGHKNAPKQGSKFKRIVKEVSALLVKYNCVPANHLRDLIPVDSDEFNIEYFNPLNIKYYEAACDLYTLSHNKRSLLDFSNLYAEYDNPIFYAHDLNPFEYYHNRVDSLKYLNELILFQCQGNEDKVKELLYNIKYWFDRKGWWENNELNSKINCIIILGAPNSGKNYFWDTFAAIAANVGHVGRVNNKTNNFALQDCVGKRLIMGNEISMEEGAKEDFKKLCEGSAFNIRVKFQGDKIFSKTPVCLISNNTLDISSDPHFRNVRCKTFRWQTCISLKNSNKKPYPLAIFDLFEMYNVDLLTINK